MFEIYKLMSHSASVRPMVVKNIDCFAQLSLLNNTCNMITIKQLLEEYVISFQMILERMHMLYKHFLNQVSIQHIYDKILCHYKQE